MKKTNHFKRELGHSDKKLHEVAKDTGIPVASLGEFINSGKQLPKGMVNKVAMSLGCPNYYLTTGRPLPPLSIATLKTIRNHHRLTVEELAELSGVSVTTIGRYESRETRNPRASILKKLAEALDVPISEAPGMPPKENEESDREEVDTSDYHNRLTSVERGLVALQNESRATPKGGRVAELEDALKEANIRLKIMTEERDWYRNKLID